jgi:hypothetical protein
MAGLEDIEALMQVNIKKKKLIIIILKLNSKKIEY